jgi:hypothetical protein
VSHHHRLILVFLTLLVTLEPLSDTVQAAPAISSPLANRPASEPYRYSAETGHTLRPPITAAYDAAGGAGIMGLPLTEVFTDTDGLRVQYFERARFELHPTPSGVPQVARTLLGSLLTRDRTGVAFSPRDAGAVSSTALYVPETRHLIGGAFRTYWQHNGGVEVFGYPISEELIEPEGVQGTPQVVQWFERARFVFRPDGPPGEQVQLSPLGRIFADQQALSAAVRAPVPPLLKLGEGRFAFTSTSPTGQNVLRALTRLDGSLIAPQQRLSFNVAIGEVSARAGYLPAGMIVSGVVTDGVGGGICMVSSALYVAALRAGLAIAARRGHSLLLRFAEAAPGMEAAVAQPDLDLVIRNDTPYPLTVAAYAQDGVLIVSLWGQSDGRTTTIGAPVINSVQTVPDEWVFDPSLSPGVTRRVSQGNDGMQVQITREVRTADGRVMARSVLHTRYAPWPAVYRYGPGVTPPGAAPTSAATTTATPAATTTLHPAP